MPFIPRPLAPPPPPARGPTQKNKIAMVSPLTYMDQIVVKEITVTFFFLFFVYHFFHALFALMCVKPKKNISQNR